MAGPSRIDELRKKFDENPRRYFAPLANEYRKLGDFEQAIFICQEFLPQQPGHMSGHIVYGQALFEAARHDEARTVFETALSLDPENLIALRHLGDIARAHGDDETARAWYRRVLESDPRNEEIAGILHALDAAAAAGPVAGTSPPASPPPSAPAAATPAATSGHQQPAAAAPVQSPAVTAPPSPPPVATASTAPTPAAVPAAPASGSARSVEPPRVERPPDEAALEDLAAFFTGSPDNLEREESPLGAPPSETGEELPELPTASAMSPMDGFESHFGETGRENRVSLADDPDMDALFDTSSSSSSPPIPYLEEPRHPAPSETVPTAPAAAFVTETMAELYLRQGHREEALRVYRQLVELRPDDQALRIRLRELEGPDRGEHGPLAESQVDPEPGPSIRDFLGALALRRPRGADGSIPPAPPSQEASPRANLATEDAPRGNPPPRSREGSRTSHASGDTVGGSLDALFSGAESARADQRASPLEIAFGGGREAAGSPPPSEQTGAPLRGRPATPAATELSLDHVFRHATPSSGSPGQSFSFDQFFSQQAQQDAAAAADEPSREAGAGDNDDIRQFNAWLEGLKKS